MKLQKYQFMTLTRKNSMVKKPLKEHSEKLTPTEDSKPKKIMVDDAKRLKEVRTLVIENNKSIMKTDYIVCQIYKESRFKKFAGMNQHSAKGLMQMQLGAVKQVFKYRVQQAKGGKMPSDKETHRAFEDANIFYQSDKMYDESENVKIGTEYLQYWINKKSSLEEAYTAYRGTNEAYYSVIKPCAEKLVKDPNNMQILRDGIGK